jgi:hypothetical protein
MAVIAAPEAAAHIPPRRNRPAARAGSFRGHAMLIRTILWCYGIAILLSVYAGTMSLPV